MREKMCPRTFYTLLKIRAIMMTLNLTEHRQ